MISVTPHQGANATASVAHVITNMNDDLIHELARLVLKLGYSTRIEFMQGLRTGSFDWVDNLILRSSFKMMATSFHTRAAQEGIELNSQHISMLENLVCVASVIEA